MADDPKAWLYKQVTQERNEQVILQQMKLHGFWPAGEGIPPDPPAEAAERAALEAEIATLLQTQAVIKNPEQALAEERKRRWDASKKRRADKKAQKAHEQKHRRETYEVLRRANIVHAGAGVSGGLANAVSDAVKLAALNLPVLHTGPELAQAMQIALSSLRWLTYHRKGATLVHYHRYEIAKKTGGVRCISAPKPALRKAQSWIQDNILARIALQPEAHGFVPARSILTNAQGHAGRAVVLNLDMKDFFPSITFRRVKGLFEGFGYSEQVATVLALLCTEPPRVAAELAGKVYHVALGQRVLPQGASTSPALTNILCRKLDRRLAGLARKHGFTYTRYADDVTFSGDNAAAVGRLLRSVRSIITAEGFTEHPTKTRIMRQANRQEVTGVTVNVRPTLAKKELRELRAILHNALKHGLASQNRENHPAFADSLRGRVAFACMVDPVRGGRLKESLAQVLERKE